MLEMKLSGYIYKARTIANIQQYVKKDASYRESYAKEVEDVCPSLRIAVQGDFPRGAKVG